MQPIAAGSLSELAGRIDSTHFDPSVYREAGVYVLRKAIPAAVVQHWQEAWGAFRESKLPERVVDPFNPVVIHEELPDVLATIYRSPGLLDVMQQLYPDLALFMQRFVVKDAKSRVPVFLHQDFGYDLGWPEKTAVFIPLTPVTPENGGLIFYLGTHHLGYFGDVGELNREMIESQWPSVCPSLAPGDIAMMHECTWHASGPHVSGPDRVLVQATYQPASDPSGTELLRGQWRTELRYGDVPRDMFFKRSRSTRLRELQAAVDRGTKGSR